MHTSIKLTLVACLAGLSLLGGNAGAGTFASNFEAAVMDGSRPIADTDRDAMRKPAEVLAFAGIAPGNKIADLMPGGGYFTRLFSIAVGPKGHVYTITPTNTKGLPPRFVEILSKNVGQMKSLAAGYANITPLAQPLNDISAGEALDLVWTSQNYHDIYGFWGPQAAAATNTAVFKALKRGGIYMVSDHTAKPGSGQAATTTLHRIDPEIVKKQVLAAGFVLAGESKLLRNPADKLTLIVFDPSLRGHTDQFVLKFRKP